MPSPQTNLQPRRRTSSLCENITDEQCRELLDSIPDFDGLFERKTSADVEKVLDEYLSTDETAEESSTETTHYNNNVEKGEGLSVDEAFEQLVGA